MQNVTNDVYQIPFEEFLFSVGTMYKWKGHYLAVMGRLGNHSGEPLQFSFTFFGQRYVVISGYVEIGSYADVSTIIGIPFDKVIFDEIEDFGEIKIDEMPPQANILTSILKIKNNEVLPPTPAYYSSEQLRRVFYITPNWLMFDNSIVYGVISPPARLLFQCVNTLSSTTPIEITKDRIEHIDWSEITEFPFELASVKLEQRVTINHLPNGMAIMETDIEKLRKLLDEDGVQGLDAPSIEPGKVLANAD